MGTVYNLCFDKFNLFIPNNRIIELKHDFESYWEEEISDDYFTKHDSYWLIEDEVGYKPMWDIHLKKLENGILFDEIYVEVKSEWLLLLKFIKQLFIKYKGTIWAWTFDDSNGEFYNFFKIEDGKERTFDFINRPNNWLLPIDKKQGDNLIDININDLLENVDNNGISFRSDKMELNASENDVKGIIQNLFDKYYKTRQVKFYHYNDKDKIDSYFNYIIKHHPKYDETFQWIGPISLVVHFKRISNEKIILIDISISKYHEGNSQDIEILIDFSKTFMDFTMKNHGTLWGYYKSRRKWFNFFKIEEGKFYKYQFNSRPDEW